MNFYIMAAIWFTIVVVALAIHACYQIGGVVNQNADFWTCYYLLVPNWFREDQFNKWMDELVPLNNQQVTRREAFEKSPEFAEQTIKTISEVLTSDAPYDVYEIVTV